MEKNIVGITKYKEKIKSVKEVIELSGVFKNLSGNEKVFIKPNIVFWNQNPLYPKFGVITTSRVVEDIIIALKDHGINDITIGEGIVLNNIKDRETPKLAYEYLGYNKFKDRYGVKTINVHERPFEKVDIGDGITLKYNSDALNSDLIVSLPVLKTHAQSKVTLAIKNLKGLIDVSSRKKCHSVDTEKDLDFFVARLSDNLPPSVAIVDGIYTNEWGPNYDGRMRRENILIASSDLFSADKVGARILGFDPSEIPHFVHFSKNNHRPIDFSDIEIVGEDVKNLQTKYEYKFPYYKKGDISLPFAFKKMGIKGLSYRQYDNTICTYCSGLTGAALTAISYAWNGEPWDDIEIVLGKRMNPTPGKKKTILFGQCMYKKHKDNPVINEMIPIKGCPAKLENIESALKQAGIDTHPEIFQNIHKLPIFGGVKYLHRYKEFEESFYNEDAKTETVPPISDIIVCQHYFDNENENNDNNLPKKQGRFEVMFYGLFGENSVKEIKNINVEGPNNYEFELLNQPYDNKNGNGYIIDNYERKRVRFVGFDIDGFLEDGKYTITVQYANDDKRKKSRILTSKNKIDGFLSTFLKNRKEMKYDSSNPPNESNDLNKPIRLSWTTLDKIAGMNAYYFNRVSEGHSKHINLQNLFFKDNMFSLSMLMPSYGLNKDNVWINSRRLMKPNTDYTWVTEICDTNCFKDLNISILQQHQHFKTSSINHQ